MDMEKMFFIQTIFLFWGFRVSGYEIILESWLEQIWRMSQ